MKTTFKLSAGEKLNRNPNNPVIIASKGFGYIWIGNNAENDKACYATLSGRKTLLALASAIRKAASK